MGFNIFDRQFFGDLTQFDTVQDINVTINEPSVAVSDVATRQMIEINLRIKTEPGL